MQILLCLCRAANRLLCLGVCCGLLAGCSGLGGSRGGVPATCGEVDALFAACGFDAPLSLGGKATVDANQHHLTGKIALDAYGSGNVTFEFTSSVLFGAQREDFVFSLQGDTIRIIDRERGFYYEGDSAEHFLQDTFALDFPVAPVLKLALGGHPACESLEAPRLRVDGDGSRALFGQLGGEDFHVVFSGGEGLIDRASWPVGHKAERLEVEYDWRAQALHRVEMKLAGRDWRCRIASSK